MISNKLIWLNLGGGRSFFAAKRDKQSLHIDLFIHLIGVANVAFGAQASFTSLKHHHFACGEFKGLPIKTGNMLQFETAALSALTLLLIKVQNHVIFFSLAQC